jgi:chromosome segregation ATPase
MELKNLNLGKLVSVAAGLAEQIDAAIHFKRLADKRRDGARKACARLRGKLESLKIENDEIQKRLWNVKLELGEKTSENKDLQTTIRILSKNIAALGGSEEQK